MISLHSDEGHLTVSCPSEAAIIRDCFFDAPSKGLLDIYTLIRGVQTAGKPPRGCSYIGGRIFFLSFFLSGELESKS